jgi:uncharacterized protein YjlB
MPALRSPVRCDSLKFMSEQRSSVPARFAEFIRGPRVLTFALKDDGVIPNSKLPLLVYQEALKLPARDPAIVEELVAANGWGGSWVNGIYSFHHYHSTAHEVLGCFGGSATVQFGGPSGITQKLHCGDVVIIPAGVAHKNLGASGDFSVMGAYPAGQRWDMCYGKPGQRPRADENIARVPLPETDPVYGADGPLLARWRT